MNRIILKKVLKDNNKCIVECDIKGSTEFLKFFRGQKLSCAQEYSINIEYVPKSILVLPTVCVFLPVCWIFDAELDLNEIDEAFYDSIPNIKSGYESMYPDVIFSGKIKVKQMEKNEYSGSKRALMFSGGVDAVNSLCVHYDEKPDLISIWGADIKAGNENGWVQKYKLLEKDAELFGCKLNTVKTNFREILYESRLNDYLKKKSKKLNWWHDFQHGIGIISHSVVYAYIYHYDIVYIASSFTANDIGLYTCASDPTIDNKFKASSMRVSHDGYELSRQDKISNICQFKANYNFQIPLDVCFESRYGDNCCRCEKCYRTIMGIIAEEKNPTDFGFEKFDKKHRKKMLSDLKKYRIASANYRYRYIQEKLRKTYSVDSCPDDLLWFYKLKIDPSNDSVFYTRAFWIKRKIMRVLTRIFKIIW